MISSKQTPTPSRPRHAIWIAAGVLALGLAIGMTLLFRRPPQMGADPEVFRTVDALYTAVRSQNATRLGQCAERLGQYRADGKLPTKSANYLDGIISTAKAGSWDTATRQLYHFMIEQRRDAEK